MKEPTLEQEFAARIGFDALFASLMSDHNGAVELFKEYGPSIPKGFLQWATVTYGPAAIKGVAFQVKKALAFSTELQRQNIIDYLEVFAEKKQVISSDNSVENVDWDVNSEVVFEATLNSASRTSDKDVHSLLADLLLQVLSAEDRYSLLVSTSEDCALAIGSLSPQHLRHLALYAVVESIIPAEIPKYSDPELLDQVTWRLDVLVNPLGISALAEQDKERMCEVGVLKPSIHRRRRIDMALVHISVSNRVHRKSILERKVLGLQFSRGELSEPAKEFWSSVKGKILKGDLFLDYSSTTVGKLLGYLVLKQLSNYDGPFYEFEQSE